MLQRQFSIMDSKSIIVTTFDNVCCQRDILGIRGGEPAADATHCSTRGTGARLYARQGHAAHMGRTASTAPRVVGAVTPRQHRGPRCRTPRSEQRNRPSGWRGDTGPAGSGADGDDHLPPTRTRTRDKREPAPSLGREPGADK